MPDKRACDHLGYLIFFFLSMQYFTFKDTKMNGTVMNVAANE